MFDGITNVSGRNGDAVLQQPILVTMVLSDRILWTAPYVQEVGNFLRYIK